MTQAHIPDDCCGKPLSKVLLSGALDAAETWTCPKCGLEWRPRLMPADIRLWEPHVHIEVLRRGR